MIERNFKNLTIKDNFMFQQVMKKESICKKFLEKRLEDEILNLKYGFDNARAEGEAEGEAKGTFNTIVSSVRNMMETLKLTAQAAMDALKIPPADRPAILAAL